MKCPICEANLRPGTDRGPDCGYRIPGAQAAPNEPTYKPRSAYTPPKKTKKASCFCCLILLLPLLISIVIGVISLGEVIMTEIEIAIDQFDGRDAFDDEWPSQELVPESIPETADEGFFAIVDGTLMFLAENWDGGPIVNVPEYIGGEQVRTIGPGCFQNCNELTTILLPESVTAIAPKAFSGCEKLRGLYLHDGVQSIGQDAFEGCKALEAVSIPASVTHIAEHTFDDCASLMYIFYGGNFEDWDALYDDYINPFTTAVCLDGYFYHGAED